MSPCDIFAFLWWFLRSFNPLNIQESYKKIITIERQKIGLVQIGLWTVLQIRKAIDDATYVKRKPVILADVIKAIDCIMYAPQVKGKPIISWHFFQICYFRVGCTIGVLSKFSNDCRETFFRVMRISCFCADFRPNS